MDGARTLVRNGLMQNDLDADFHKILNLDTSNLDVGTPNGQPDVQHMFLKSYDASTRNFTLARPDILDLTGFPDQTGHANEFLYTNGSVLDWSPIATVGNTGTFFSVKGPPYNAVGDGVTDDSAAIQAAIDDAAGGTVYIPAGVYFLGSNLVGTGPTVLLGDGADETILLGDAALGGPMLTLLSGSIVSGMDFNGNLGNVVQGTQVTKTGIYINSEQDVLIKDCDICNFIARGIDKIGRASCRE